MEEAVSVALEKFDSLVKRNNEVSPNFRPIVYRCGIKNGRTSDWKYAWKMLETTRVARYVVLLGCDFEIVTATL